MAGHPPPPPPPGALFGEKYLDIPTQRILVLGLLAASQAIKFGEFTASLVEHDGPSASLLFLKWTFLDAILLWFLPYLRIPRLQFDQRARIAQITLLTGFNYVLFGNYVIFLGKFLPSPIRAIMGLFEYDELTISQRRVKIQDVIDYGAHLLGQHTVRITPIGAAIFNPDSLPFCLANPSVGVLIPILLNNSKSLSLLQYSIAPLGDKGPRDYINVTSRELNKMQSIAAAYFAEQDRLLGSAESDEDDEDDDDELDEGDGALASRVRTPQSQLKMMISSSSYATLLARKKLEKTQTMRYLRITRPGTVRLERILDNTYADVRIRRYSGKIDTAVVECPSAVFKTGDLAPLQCTGGTKQVFIDVRGTTPLTLQWHRVIGGKKEHFTVEGIEGGSESRGLPLAQEVKIPLDLPLNVQGLHVYTLETVTDGVGNVVDLPFATSHESDVQKSITVLGRSSVSFRGCGTGPDRTVDLLQGKEGTITIAFNNLDPADGPWTVTISFQPVDSNKGRKGWTKEFASQSGKKTLTIGVTEPGEYTIIKVQGKTCPGDILSPETCRVIEQPKPTAEITFQGIQECSSDTGVSATALLHGTPPFVLVYTEKHDKNPPKTLVKTFNSARGEIVLKPERSGSYTYTFIHISDRNYQRVPIAGTPSTTRHVHPLASANFVRGVGGGGMTKPADSRIHTSNCEGDFVEVSLDLSGTPPFVVDLQLVGPKGSELRSFRSLNETRETVEVPILPEFRETGGTMEIDLVSVTDANGCRRALDTTGISVFVKRVKPTIKFYSTDSTREALILDTETAHLPLRLTGDGPWDVSYQITDPAEADAGSRGPTGRVARIRSANANLDVKQPGLYTLTNVKDSHCPGRVIQEQSTYLVKTIQRPFAVFGEDAGKLSLEGIIVRPPVCEGNEDFVDIQLQGRPPFQVIYEYAGQSRERRMQDRITFNSIQNTSNLQLKTSETGHHEYHIAKVGDSAYPLVSSPELRRLSGLVLAQDVLARPSAHFKSSGTGSVCLNDKFIPKATHGSDGIVILHGQPPFKLDLAIKDLATSSVVTESVEVSSHEWKLELPNYTFKTVGPHIITIESFEDSSQCPPSTVELGPQSFRIDVAETAAILPFERREDFCVGDVLQFQLEGNAPWKIDYRFDGKLISATSKIPKFSRVAEKPGMFEIVSIAHQQASCQSSVSDLHMNIRPLPSARVSQGKNVIEDLREGEQAEIVFTLIGEPPFTFTYQRASLESHKGTHRILETHTVSGVMTYEYSIFSALEGTWTVTFISDKYCRYPPVASNSKFESI
ncbi:uncharacterized protein EI90DRAFT_3046569 [Cantharellus anzutake]|uniref:uncharacterized protein n=1 Tax=Cantharellus anzutake TaxID=1750568 RepID=UPI00190360A8|nr:uncharacterized protein EI90DRAFT_3046569 [Cantharellus anzutake]KAF8336634.1 hypothetical protein EI90DRAFT_3046569 [Cantharellus anzutake]